MRSCVNGSISFGTRSKNQPTLSMFSSSMGTPPFEVAAGEETVRPQASAPDGPKLVRLRLTFQNTAVDEPVLKLVEADLQMGRRLRPLVTLQDTRPVAVQPLEVHRVDRV